MSCAYPWQIEAYLSGSLTSIPPLAGTCQDHQRVWACGCNWELQQVLLHDVQCWGVLGRGRASLVWCKCERGRQLRSEHALQASRSRPSVGRSDVGSFWWEWLEIHGHLPSQLVHAMSGSAPELIVTTHSMRNIDCVSVVGIASLFCVGCGPHQLARRAQWGEDLYMLGWSCKAFFENTMIWWVGSTEISSLTCTRLVIQSHDVAPHFSARSLCRLHLTGSLQISSLAYFHAVWYNASTGIRHPNREHDMLKLGHREDWAEYTQVLLPWAHLRRWRSVQGRCASIHVAIVVLEIVHFVNFDRGRPPRISPLHCGRFTINIIITIIIGSKAFQQAEQQRPWIGRGHQPPPRISPLNCEGSKWKLQYIFLPCIFRFVPYKWATMRSFIPCIFWLANVLCRLKIIPPHLVVRPYASHPVESIS